MFTPTLVPGALFGLVVALLISANAMRIGVLLGLLDLPDGARKVHAQATPLVGGIAVTLAAIGGLIAASWLARDSAPALLALEVAAMFAIGVIDDRSHLSPHRRLLAALGVLLPVLLIEPQFQLDHLYFATLGLTWSLSSIFGLTFTLICMVGLLNAINMADGKNGVVAGMALVWTAVLAVHAPPILWPALAATGAALAVVLGFNMAGKLFLGDGGSYALSALFGLMAIFIYNAPGSGMAADDVALLFAVPVFDTIRLMVVRVAGGRSAFDGDRDHLHHHIHARIGWPQGLPVYLALVALPNAAAMVWRGTSLYWLMASLVAYAAVIVAMRVPRAEAAPAE